MDENEFPDELGDVSAEQWDYLESRLKNLDPQTDAILPTGTCFDDAIAFLERRVREQPALADSETLLVVHGLKRGPLYQSDLDLFAHGWIEEWQPTTREWLVWNAGILRGVRIEFSVQREEYYAETRVDRDSVRRYTPRQVWEENYRSGHFGPWTAELQAACRDPKVP